LESGAQVFFFIAEYKGEKKDQEETNAATEKSHRSSCYHVTLKYQVWTWRTFYSSFRIICSATSWFVL